MAKGLITTEINTGSGAVKTVSTAILGLVATGPAADAAAFPIGKPVVFTDIDAAIAKAGAGGTLKASLEAIATQVSPVVVVVRVTPGGTQADTDTAVANGVAVLGQAPALIGVRPRILGAPGLDTPTVRAALAVVCGKSKLDAFAYVKSKGVTVAERIADRATMSARETMAIAGDFLFGTTTYTATAVAMGLRAKIDKASGPQKTLSNVAVEGVTGLTEALSWSLHADAATDVGLLTDADVTCLVPLTGFRFWGNRTTSDDDLFAFESTVRVGQMLRDLIAAAIVKYMDKDLTPQLARDLVEYINAQLAEVSRPGGWLLGGRAWLDATINTVDGLKRGKLAIDYDYGVPSPLEELTLRQRITDRYYTDFVAQAAA